MFGKIKTKFLLIPAKETPNMGSKQFDCLITSLHFKLCQSEMPIDFQKVPWKDFFFLCNLFNVKEVYIAQDTIQYNTYVIDRSP